MVRMNITMPDDLIRELKLVKNKSRFIAEALREKFLKEQKKKTAELLIEGYKKSAEEDKELNEDWDVTTGDGVE